MDFKDSEIIDIPPSNFQNNLGEVYELIHITSHSLLYRMRKDGKYFIIKRNILTDEIGRSILRREYEIATGLSHPNIVDVYEYRFDENYQDCIVMEYVDGRTLNDFLAEKPSLKTKIRLFSELLDAIDYLHKNRIIHNDIKPENIIITRLGDHIKLIDLGLSDDDIHYAIKSIGFTKGFSAPELINEGKSDNKSDIYSLGIISQLLFGNRYREINRKCTYENPDKRYQDIGELKKKWKRIYWRWLTPLIGLVMLIFIFIIFLIIKDRNFQIEEREALEKEILLQKQELKEQKESFINIKNSYDSLKDSVDNAQRLVKEHEEKKKSIINKFSRELKILTNATIDSLNKASSFMEMYAIKLNFKNKVNSYYESYDKFTDDEDIISQLKLIKESELLKVDKKIDGILPQNTMFPAEFFINP